jgi:RNA polymerase sigma factor (sigma-70 family)
MKRATKPNPTIKRPPVRKPRLAQADRDRLVLDYLPLAYKLAWEEQCKHGGDIDDLKQEAALAMLKAMPDYDPMRGAFVTFARAAIRHHFLNLARDRVPSEEQMSFDPIDRRSLALPSETAEEVSAGLAKIRAAIGALDRRQRRATRLVLLSGKTVRQAAGSIGVSYETVRKLVRAASQQLAIRLGISASDILGQFKRWRRKA